MVNAGRVFTCGECGGEPREHRINSRFVPVFDPTGRVIRIARIHSFVVKG